jgi:magnesium transporter
MSRKIDEDLVAMYLTDKKNGIQREPRDHQELEVLLESFAKQVEEIVNETDTTQVRLVPSHG